MIGGTAEPVAAAMAGRRSRRSGRSARSTCRPCSPGATPGSRRRRADLASGAVAACRSRSTPRGCSPCRSSSGPRSSSRFRSSSPRWARRPRSSRSGPRRSTRRRRDWCRSSRPPPPVHQFATAVAPAVALATPQLAQLPEQAWAWVPLLRSHQALQEPLLTLTDDAGAPLPRRRGAALPGAAAGAGRAPPRARAWPRPRRA